MPPASVDRMLRLALGCLLLGLVVGVPAANAAGTTQILRDCADDGVLQGNYSPSELRKARKNIPTDTDEYTDCRDVLSRAAAGGVAARRGLGLLRQRRHGRRRRRLELREPPAESPNTPEAQDAIGKAAARAPAPVRPIPSAAAPSSLATRASRRRRPQRPAGAADLPARAARRRGPRHPHPVRPSPCHRSLPALRPRVRRPYTRTVTVPWAGPGGWLSLSVALTIVLSTFVARGGVRLEPTTAVEIGLMLAGAAAWRSPACAGARPATASRP